MHSPHKGTKIRSFDVYLLCFDVFCCWPEKCWPNNRCVVNSDILARIWPHCSDINIKQGSEFANWNLAVCKTRTATNKSRQNTADEVRAMSYDVIIWKHFPRYWPFVRGIHRSPVNSRHKGQWRGTLMFSVICAWTNRWVAGDLRRHRSHYDVIVMKTRLCMSAWPTMILMCNLWANCYNKKDQLHLDFDKQPRHCVIQLYLTVYLLGPP